MKKAFTLAEVLITLMIIGIVAALTIPSVISNYQQQEFKTGLKKAVSVLNEAIQTNIAQEGETPYEIRDLYSYLKRHMNVIKTGFINHCYDKTTGALVVLDDNQKGCMDAGAGFIKNNVFYTADGMRFEMSGNAGGNGKEFSLHESDIKITGEDRIEWDGHTYKSAMYGANGWCGSYGLSVNPNNTKYPPCLIMVDVNGDRKPNPQISYETKDKAPYYPANQNFEYNYSLPDDKKLQDIFTIMITEEKAIPFGVVAQRAMYSK